MDSEVKRENYGEIKKREKELEKRIAEYENNAKENKKYLQRL